ncbi:MAG TPA: polysaccharide deacetylase family protein [Rubrivivax sp.]|jgi:peptidoglycan/xylan/chitin deacetylase (PgdA/CDA1 family)|nr:polysaccharide deacetylase family protein [Rhodoferax sp.]MCL4739360.1 polysaccharide deacetylase family protein [Burkholderiaceae bacterium]MCP5287870.1 polysaccharide deacetylase family protein [Burkholderiaceae bacterium]HMR68789.1 polysaccharide deacetylase family protein [Rubrivivax sp.]
MTALPDPGVTRRGAQAVAAALLLLVLAGCASEPPPAWTRRPVPAAASAQHEAADRWPGANGVIAGRHERLLVYVPGGGDTLEGIAARFYGSAADAWRIAEANAAGWSPPSEGYPLVVPLVDTNPLGVDAEGAQLVPVLTYHRFGPRASKMTVTPAQFEAQLQWLARERFSVVRLSDLGEFLAGRRALPGRSVVITVDDGYNSFHRYAFPLLLRYGVPATMFVYTDFVGAGDALSWAQLRELAASGLVDVQAHSKSHRNLAQREPGETDDAYLRSIEIELRAPRAEIERRLADEGVRVRQFAYPFGDANQAVLDTMRRLGYEIGATVDPGGNAFFAHPLMLRRTMIFGDHDLDAFAARVATRLPVTTP